MKGEYLWAEADLLWVDLNFYSKLFIDCIFLSDSKIPGLHVDLFWPRKFKLKAWNAIIFSGYISFGCIVSDVDN